MNLLALAIAPGIAICIYIYCKDRYNKEPLHLLLLSFFLGMLSTIPAIIFQVMSGISIESLQGKQLSDIAHFAFLVVALSEELSKFAMVRLFLYPKKAFDEPFDGIVYAVMVSMGFATLENIGYVMQHGVSTGIVRMFLSVPAHATFGVIMGYYLGLAKFDRSKRMMHIILSIAGPVIFHGAFDFFLFVGKNIFYMMGTLVSFYIAIRLSRKAIKKHQELSARHFNNEGWNDSDRSLL
ncbi:MAG: PrsW family glutamic-type intramembrane protease [Ferruginibacter sp.]